ncbi:MAG: serine/threonine protein kinase, partial [Planctomycetota bacterium]
MELPARIGKYELQEFLGGGMSHVYRAVDTVIGRTVAVKILTEAGCEDAEAKARFLAEARMAGNISHDNVLSIYDFGEDERGRPFMVMEFLRGEDLRHAIRDQHTGGVREKLNIALQVARALEYVHSQRIVHRDIKPENIHVTGAGLVKLMDFGIAKTEGLGMTRAGYVLGTPYYMSPEQVTGQAVTEQVDVYAFGVLLFELFTGTKPINGDTVERIFYSILNEPLNLEPLREAGAPEAISKLVAHCTAKSPAERPQGFAQVCTELERIGVELDAPTLQIVFRKPEPQAAS